jgi:hypothetical protein
LTREAAARRDVMMSHATAAASHSHSRRAALDVLDMVTAQTEQDITARAGISGAAPMHPVALDKVEVLEQIRMIGRSKSSGTSTPHTRNPLTGEPPPHRKSEEPDNRYFNGPRCHAHARNLAPAGEGGPVFGGGLDLTEKAPRVMGTPLRG